jgi:DNA-binding transcriptional LysR family regulator
VKTLTDLRKLRHVVGVAHAGSFTAASHALSITQSALTKSVAEVEQLLGLTLFQRLPRGVNLTDAGSLFVRHAERILADTSDLMAHLGQLNDLSAGHLRIGVTPAAYAAFLERPVSTFAERYPGLHIDIRDGTVDAITLDLASGHIDLAIGAVNYLSQWSDLELQPVAQLHYFFIGRRDHPLSKKKPSAAELLQYPVVMPAAGFTTEAELNKAYTQAGLAPEPPRYTCDHFPLVKRIVAATDAISPVVSLAPAGERFGKEFHVFEDVIALEAQMLGIATARRFAPTPAASAFKEMFGATLEDPTS